ncbi:MAG: hypothetical protein KatS3mg015_2516 [Fimbriimonadales bacterium]|nr:MAG: hypothetical protein KatS3mg015_2516 [Fimbriimonadales bacterium]
MSLRHQDTDFGFEWGPVCVERAVHDDEIGWVLVVRPTDRDYPRVEIRVSPRGRSWSVRDMAEYGLHAWHPVGESPWLARRRHRKSESPMARSGRKVGEL